MMLPTPLAPGVSSTLESWRGAPSATHVPPRFFDVYRKILGRRVGFRVLCPQYSDVKPLTGFGPGPNIAQVSAGGTNPCRRRCVNRSGSDHRKSRNVSHSRGRKYSRKGGSYGNQNFAISWKKIRAIFWREAMMISAPACYEPRKAAGGAARPVTVRIIMMFLADRHGKYLRCRNSISR